MWNFSRKELLGKLAHSEQTHQDVLVKFDPVSCPGNSAFLGWMDWNGEPGGLAEMYLMAEKAAGD